MLGHSMAVSDRTQVTYRFERWRALASGVLEVAATVFLLLIAVKHYHAGPIAKAMIAGGGSLGLILAPWFVSRVEAAGWPVARAASKLMYGGAFCLGVMAAVPLLPVYVAGSVLSMTASAISVPLLIQIYQENYPERERGRLFARTMMIRIATAAIFSEMAGRVLSHHLEFFRVLLLIFAGAFALSGYCLGRCPSRPLTASGGTHPFHALRYARDDRLFRQTLIAWMFLGFAMLMMSPLRVEYLANPKYGVHWKGQLLTAGAVALLTAVIPNIARLLLNPVWGWLFDHVNFFVLRLSLNLALVAGILSFFINGSELGLVVGAIVFGISNAGADVAWSLWVTKFAPPDRVADYMSVHTFFTGVRGVVAPFVAFHLIAIFSVAALGWFSGGLIFVASLMLLPEIPYGRGRAHAAALVEEVSE